MRAPVKPPMKSATIPNSPKKSAIKENVIPTCAEKDNREAMNTESTLVQELPSFLRGYIMHRAKMIPNIGPIAKK